MNKNPSSTTQWGDWIFSPFHRLAGWPALMIGVGIILMAGLIGSMSQTHFDGVLDTHTGMATPLWVYLVEGLLNWLCLAVILWIAGRLAKGSSFRALDLFGTQALARWPTIFSALATQLPGYRRFGAELMRQVGLASAVPAAQAGDGVAFGFTFLVVLVATIWMVALMYRSYRFVSHLPLGRTVATFLIGLLLAEAASKVALMPIYTRHANSLPKAANASTPLQAPVQGERP